ncbi:LITAF domain-containing protein-like isoform X1 [Ptychodera flava]|uniref:LITAF domain-containing protein-like isoform X1 n=1 Tax=Ptychodera flava TaxID=63121 RepID=UPI00396A6E43
MSDRSPAKNADQENKRDPDNPNSSPQRTQPTLIVTKPKVHKTKFDSVFTEAPACIICPRCQQRVVTDVVYVNGSCTWLTCTCLCCFCCILGCCLIPFCVDRCLDVEHHCPECKWLVGKYERL